MFSGSWNKGLELRREVGAGALDKSGSLGRAHWDGPTEDNERGGQLSQLSRVSRARCPQPHPTEKGSCFRTSLISPPWVMRICRALYKRALQSQDPRATLYKSNLA